MRSYLDIIIDVKDGIPVEYEELRLALLFASDILFFVEKDLQEALKTDNGFMHKFIEESINKRIENKRNALDIWWKGNPPKELEKYSADAKDVLNRRKALEDTITAKKFDPKKALADAFKYKSQV
jgi:hypothetical protein